MNAPSPAGIYLLALILLTGVSVKAQLNVNFTVDKTSGCSPLTVSFTNKTTGASANAVYSWDLGNGNTSALASPSGIYIDEKSYTVTLTVRDGSQTASRTATVTVHPKPVVDFSAPVVKGCNPVNTTFTTTVQPGSGGITSYHWDLGDGSTRQSASPSISHNYTQVQKASVILTATNNFGCYSTVSKKDYITILPALTANFTADKNMVCRAGDPVQFTNTSTGPGTLSYAWNFSNGNTSTQQNPQHVYNTKGVYSVSLTVNSSEGCAATKTLNNLNVETYRSDFSVPVPVCTGVGNMYTNTSTPAASTYSWYVNNQNTYYNNTSLYHYLYSSGTYTIKLVNTFGTCKDSAEKQVSVKQTSVLNGFVANIKGVCGAPVDVEFNDTTPNAAKWEWDFDYYNGINVESYVKNPVHRFTGESNWLVKLTMTNTDGCVSSVFQNVNVIGPQVTIGYVNPNDPSKNPRYCTNNPIGFRAYTNEEIVSYNWNFGDGGTSALENPVHVYTTPATYHVTLTYTTKKGCTRVAHMFYDVPIAQESKITNIVASTNTVCGNQPVNFTATVTNSTLGGQYYYWNFGDGTSSGGYQYANTVSHQYFKDDTYTVTLIYGGINGYCPDTMTMPGVVKVLPPIPKITAWENTCDGMRDTVTFKQSTVKGQTWTWDFGDGATSTLTTDEPSVKHGYANTGTYKVVLTATNGACSVRDSVTAYVLKKQYPILSSVPASVCKNDPIPINVSNVERNPFGRFYWIEKALYGDDSYAGSWGGNDFETVFNGYLSYNNLIPGKKDLKVVIRNYSGSYYHLTCYDTTNVVPFLVKGPIVGYKITNNNVCFNTPAAFQDTSISVGGTIQKWEWSFGDGQTNVNTQGGTVSHTYNTPGDYWVSLKVTDNSGCQGATSSYYSPVEITGPKAAFSTSATTIALAGTVNFFNNTNNNNAFGTTYRWQIDGVEFSTDFSPSYTFNQAGTYTITLIATGNSGSCSSTASQVITVKNFNAAFDMITAAITPNSCPPVLVRYTNKSQNYNRLVWNFGDGTVIENVANPSHFYEQAGKYYITLQVYGANGVNGTFYDSVTILQPEAVMQSSALDICKGSSITLNAVAKNTGAYVWDFGDGSVVSTTDTFATHQYSTSGLYSPTLIMEQAATGCTGSVPLPDKINVRPNPVVTISPAQPLICKGASIPLQASGGVTYEWLPAADLSNTAIANPVASPLQTSSYTVKVTDDIGCKNTSSVTVEVVQPVQVVVSGDNEICQGETVNLKAGGAAIYKWVNDIDGLSDINIPDPTATPGGTITYSVAGSDAHSCFSDTAGIRIEVRPLPAVSAGQDAQSWPGEPVPLQATGSSDVINYKWTPADYLSCTDCANPVCTPLSTKSYAITVKNQYGCAATDTVVVKLLCDENRVRIPNGFTPNGDGRNDEFIIKGIGIIKHLVIFNRWGQKVYDRSNFIAGDRSLCWNGTFNGYPAEAGSYVYFVELECPEGTFSKKGTMTLVR
ncbi:PKD domain-containing protein [Niastella populi]|uniref:PKD domain-containing protein n=1 Tax=Niastella populi TaxID=550983 RepID=A0A1V9G5E6_9BACT|nr:PKD domain-containing protein [Niastella populi]OQP65696.1 hypothetical protein A4R26_14820 [Niastella populi]